jgi:hypothetical protein
VRPPPNLKSWIRPCTCSVWRDAEPEPTEASVDIEVRTLYFSCFICVLYYPTFIFIKKLLFKLFQWHRGSRPFRLHNWRPTFGWRRPTTKRRAFISSLGSYWRCHIYQQTTSDPHSTTWSDKQHPFNYSCWSTILPTPGSTTQHGVSSSGLCSVRPSGPTMMLKVIFIFYLFILRCLEYSVNNIYTYIHCINITCIS